MQVEYKSFSFSSTVIHQYVHICKKMLFMLHRSYLKPQSFFFFFAICSARTSRSLRWSRPTLWSSANLHGCGELKWAPATKGSVLGMRQSGPESPSHRERLCWAWTLSGELLKTFDIPQKLVWIKNRISIKGK